MIVQKKSGPVRAVLRAGMRLIKRFYPTTPTVRHTNFNGFKFLVWANEHIGQRILTVGSFEPEELGYFPRLVSKGDVCIDVGANIGVHTLNLARAVGPSGQVIAFEPVRRNALLLMLSCDLNEIGNVSVIMAPVSNETGVRLRQRAPVEDSGYAYFTQDQEGTPSLTLDRFCQDNAVGQISFIKIDVEGAELNVLRGAEGLLGSDQHPQTIVVEVVDQHLKRFGSSAESLVKWLASYGYAPFVLRAGKLEETNLSNIADQNVFFRKSN